MLKGFLDSRLTLTTPIPDPPSQHDTAPIACAPHPPTNRNSHYIHLLRVLHSADTHPGQGQRPVCGEIHTSNKYHIHTTNTHSRRATPATYLCYITHATAYPSTGRSALHSANGDASPQLLHCKSNTMHPISQPGRLISDMRTGPLGCWC